LLPGNFSDQKIYPQVFFLPYFKHYQLKSLIENIKLPDLPHYPFSYIAFPNNNRLTLKSGEIYIRLE